MNVRTFILLIYVLIPGMGLAGSQMSGGVPAAQLEVARAAKKAFDLGKYEEAESIYESILADVPDNLYALSNLGVTRLRQGNYEGAVLALQRALVVEESDAFSHRTLGFVYYRLHRFEQATRSLTRAVQLDATDANAHLYLCAVYSCQGLVEAARREQKIAIELNPNCQSVSE